ncbi:MAG: hypothetical protein NW223_10500 [Hyphomicrobiaceae bacterium]|nr:hypothetical protein [Hyphomicrobiaceae bacterium]
MDAMTVGNFERWGRLVKTWATGVSYFLDDSPAVTIDQLPVPRSLDELKRQADLVRANVSIPDHMVGLAVVQYSVDTVVIRLPPAERIKAKEVELSAQTGTYPFPDFYAQNIGQNLSVERKLALHAARIGDYTISMCG